MSANTKQSRAAQYSLVLGPFGGTDGFSNRASGAISTGMGTFTVPPVPNSYGITVRKVTMRCTKVAGTPGAVVDVLHGLTSILSSTVTFTGIATTDGTLANNGTEVVAAGDRLIISGVESGANKWDSTVQAAVVVQIDYSRNAR